MTPDDIRRCFLGALKRISLYGFHPYGSGNTSTGYSLTAALDYHYLTEDPPRGTWTACVDYLDYLFGVDPWYWQETQGTHERAVEVLLHGAERSDQIHLKNGLGYPKTL